MSSTTSKKPVLVAGSLAVLAFLLLLLLAQNARSVMSRVNARVDRDHTLHAEDRAKTDAIRARLAARSGIDLALVEARRAAASNSPAPATLECPLGASYSRGRDVIFVQLTERSPGTLAVVSKGEIRGEDDQVKAAATVRATIRTTGEVLDLKEE